MCRSISLLFLFLIAAAGFVTAAKDDPQELTLSTTMEIRGLVRHRYATVQFATFLHNPSEEAVETNVTFFVPENAFVSYATLEVDGEVIRGQVQERKAVVQQYQLAVGVGASASQVSAVRDASEVRVSVNVGARSTATFNLTYEELLTRRQGRYQMTLNVHPQQKLESLKLEVEIKESRNFTFINVPPFRDTMTPDDLDNDVSNKDVKIKFLEEEGHCLISYSTDSKLPGPFFIRYDVDRETNQGEVLLLDGYFVHFVTAEREKARPPTLPKHAIFVLDSSASMWGPKLRQQQVAMTQILRQLDRHDVFSIVTFGNKASEWTQQGLQPSLGKGVYAANRRNIADAIDFISRMQATGGTNIQAGLRRALYLAAKYRNIPLIPGVSEGANYSTPTPKEVQTLVTFVSDGVPTAGEIRLTRLLKSIQFANQNTRASVFALALGPSANYGFLRRLALQNFGFSRRIYEGADTALQLQSFFREISSPLLHNVTFAYVDNKVNFSSVTLRHFPTLFAGGEVVVAGRLDSSFDPEQEQQVIGSVTARGVGGEKVSTNITLPEGASKINSTGLRRRRIGVLEKIWAHMTIRQLLDNYLIEDFGDSNSTLQDESRTSNNKERALALALKYGFVTPLTSLVMVSENKKRVTLIAADDVEKDLKQPEQLPFNNKVVPPILLPMSIQQAALSNKTEESTEKSPFEKFDWLTFLLAENDSVTFIKTNGEEITRIVLKETEDKESNRPECTFKGNDEAEVKGTCKPLLTCPSTQVPTFDEYLRRHCDFDDASLAVCCES
ncbi:inter-alpha-trypsin inhibitor heavy chain H4-like [Neocloeon triangulifer]|uniref:inter-alpha-trypsin inhibitor heavy chain H4-like n=1 Tax=Neocloeon triangulifer TaxID=2078957 RepID=UPI00286F807D|nr:inter-alpha-trypsin inhibitor heavy chain H4-like [Neocloeon triangulifer]XP_059487610.1 inter-alpha-trypsin inhibitor heavy chain H4-like [Neocloeon triangulifer]